MNLLFLRFYTPFYDLLQLFFGICGRMVYFYTTDMMQL